VLVIGAAISFIALQSPTLGGLLLFIAILMVALVVGIAQQRRPARGQPSGGPAFPIRFRRPGRPVVERYSITQTPLGLQADSSILRGCLLVLAVIGGVVLLLFGLCVGVLFPERALTAAMKGIYARP